MSASSRPRSLSALALAGLLVLVACSPPGPDVAAASNVEPEPGSAAHRLTLTTRVEGAGGRTGLVELRATVVGGHRHVVLDSPLGPVGEHVVTPDDHWFRLPPLIADPLGFPTDWVHVPLDELAAAGAEVPASLAEVRAPLPDPASVDVGDLVYGTLRVLAVERRDAASARLELDDGSVVDVRREELPRDTTVAPPTSAIEVRDLPALVRG